MTSVAPEAPAADPNALIFRIPNTETDINIDITKIPAEARLELLKKAIKDHVTNRVNQTNVRHKKALAPWDAYDEAVKADALQSAVAKPTGDKPTVDLIAPAAAARADLYEGKLRTQTEGGKPREAKDPLIAAVTSAVVRELFEKNKVTQTGYKYTDAVKEVSGDGVAYLNARIAEKVAAGGDEKALNKFLEDRYMKPARIMLGRDLPKSISDQSSIL